MAIGKESVRDRRWPVGGKRWPPGILGIVALLLASVMPAAPAATGMTLESPAFQAGSIIPRRFTCAGAGVSPPLIFAGVPPAAKSLALVVHDPDAPAGDWVHWVVYDIAPHVVVLAAGAASQSLPGPAHEANNSYHHLGYGALCPPKGNGVHHYHFVLYALNTRLPAHLRDRAALRRAMQGHIMARARLVGRYRRAP